MELTFASNATKPNEAADIRFRPTQNFCSKARIAKTSTKHVSGKETRRGCQEFESGHFIAIEDAGPQPSYISVSMRTINPSTVELDQGSSSRSCVLSLGLFMVEM